MLCFLSTEKRMKHLKLVLKNLGLNSERLRLEWISASEGAKFQTVVREFTEKIEELGPNPINKKELGGGDENFE